MGMKNTVNSTQAKSTEVTRKVCLHNPMQGMMAEADNIQRNWV